MPRYSWKERYYHAVDTYLPLWNAAMNYIAETYGEDGFARYLKYFTGMQKKVIHPVNIQALRKEGAKAMLPHLTSHFEMLGVEMQVKKSSPSENAVLDRIRS